MRIMKQSVIIIPGSVELAMLASMIDVSNWLVTQIRNLEPAIKKAYEIGSETWAEKPFAGRPFLSIKIEPIGDMAPLKVELFGERTCFFKLIVDIPNYGELEEPITNELKVAINRRVYGLINALTSRELEILEKRIAKRKTVTETAAEMNISPQGVVSFLNSIRGKVQKYLFIYGF